jgi:peptidoglycan hydrolase-like protein with peptidoglycan-binding domain
MGSSKTVSTANLKPGVAHPDVSVLQRALIARGFAIPAGVTGYFGSQTTEATKKFQRAQGWTGSDADGIPGPGTLTRLGLRSATSGGAAPATSAPTSPKPTVTTPSSPGTGRVSLANLVPGTVHKDVYVLQQTLIRKGYAIPAGATGYFGAKTSEAIKKFQRAQGWRGSDADGIPGPGTLKRLGL